MSFRILPAQARDVAWIAQLEAETYSAADAIPERVLAAWFQQNPCGFNIIEKAGGERIGHFDILPLVPDAIAPFLRGEISEKEISPKWVMPAISRSSPCDLYIESIIIKPSSGLAARPALYEVFARFDQIVGRICAPENVRNIYAMEASAVGKKVMLNLGFSKIENFERRSREHEVFQVSYAQLFHKLRSLLRRGK